MSVSWDLGAIAAYCADDPEDELACGSTEPCSGGGYGVVRCWYSDRSSGDYWIFFGPATKLPFRVLTSFIFLVCRLFFGL